MRFIKWLVTGIAATFTFVGLFRNTLLIVAAMAVVLLLLVNSIYAPPPNHVGVIFRFKRFNRWVEADEWCWLIPIVEHIGDPISLELRTLSRRLEGLMTGDRVLLSPEFVITYRLAPAKTEPKNPSQDAAMSPYDVINMTPDKWEALIARELTDTAARYVSGWALSQLLTGAGQQRFKRWVALELSKRLLNKGIEIDENDSLKLVKLQIDDAFLRAIVDEVNATSQGRAAAVRLESILSLNDHHTVNPQSLLALVWSAASIQNGSAPQIIAPSMDN